MKERFRSKVQHFLRGAGSVIDLQPQTRQNQSPKNLEFNRTVFIGGHKYELGAKGEPFKQIKAALTSDWKKVVGGINYSARQLTESSRVNGTRTAVK